MGYSAGSTGELLWRDTLAGSTGELLWDTQRATGEQVWRDTRRDPLASCSGRILGGIHWRAALAGYWVGAWCRSIANADSNIKPNNPFLSVGEQEILCQEQGSSTCIPSTSAFILSNQLVLRSGPYGGVSLKGCKPPLIQHKQYQARNTMPRTGK